MHLEVNPRYSRFKDKQEEFDIESSLEDFVFLPDFRYSIGRESFHTKSRVIVDRLNLLRVPEVGRSNLSSIPLRIRGLAIQHERRDGFGEDLPRINSVDYRDSRINKGESFLVHRRFSKKTKHDCFISFGNRRLLRDALRFLNAPEDLIVIRYGDVNWKVYERLGRGDFGGECVESTVRRTIFLPAFKF